MWNRHQKEPIMLNLTAAAHAKLLLVDDDNEQRELCAMVLRMSGFRVLTAACPSEALALIAEHAIHVAVLDYEMPEMNGGRLAGEIRARYRDIRIILYSGALSIAKHEIAHVDVFVAKGNGVTSLLATIFDLIHARTAVGLDAGFPTFLQFAEGI
jgi:CheY-like chemotaxis protein